jgi:arginyl-tRNA synthetase
MKPKIERRLPSAYSSAKTLIRKAVEDSIQKLGLPTVAFEPQEPPRGDFGDFSVSVAFQISKSIRLPPAKIAKDIVSSIHLGRDSLIEAVKPHESGYANFSLNRVRYTEETIKQVVKDSVLIPQIGKGKTATIEHSSVNPNKALHVGHLRNVILGDSLVRIFRKVGHEVKVLNYIDDSGSQVADLIVGFKHLGYDLNPNGDLKFDHYSGDNVYVQVQREYERRPDLVSYQRKILKDLENTDSETSKFARLVTDRIVKEQLKTCWRVGAFYDCLVFESDILAEKMWDKMFRALEKKGTVRLETHGKNAGCWVADIPGEEGEKIIVRSDGTVTYIGKDIPFAAWKLGLLNDSFGYGLYETQPNGELLWRTLGGKAKDGLKKKDRRFTFSGSKVVLTVIDSRQARLQAVIQKILSDHSGKDLSGNYIHVGYAIISLSPKTAKQLGVESVDEEKQEIGMSGRKGVYVNADDVLDKLKLKALAETRKRNPSSDEKWVMSVAEQIAIAAIRFQLASPDLEKGIVFDIEQSLQLEGETGPYVQYAYARASRIVEKYGELPNLDEVTFSDVVSESEFVLTKQISKYDQSVVESAENITPKFLARYSYRLSFLFNGFYEKMPVLAEKNRKTKEARLFLVEAFRRTLRESLSLIGIPTPEKI